MAYPSRLPLWQPSSRVCLYDDPVTQERIRFESGRITRRISSRVVEAIGRTVGHQLNPWTPGQIHGDPLAAISQLDLTELELNSKPFRLNEEE